MAAFSTLDVWDGHLAAHGAKLMSARMELVNLLAPEVEKAYLLLAPLPVRQVSATARVSSWLTATPMMSATWSRRLSLNW